MGRLLKPLPERRICYLQGESRLEGWPGPGVGEGVVRAQALPVSIGVWGSAFAASLDEIFLKTTGSNLSFLNWHRGRLNITGEGADPDSHPHASFQQ